MLSVAFGDYILIPGINKVTLDKINVSVSKQMKVKGKKGHP